MEYSLCYLMMSTIHPRGACGYSLLIGWWRSRSTAGAGRLAAAQRAEARLPDGCCKTAVAVIGVSRE